MTLERSCGRLTGWRCVMAKLQSNGLKTTPFDAAPTKSLAFSALSKTRPSGAWNLRIQAGLEWMGRTGRLRDSSTDAIMRFLDGRQMMNGFAHWALPFSPWAVTRLIQTLFINE